MKTIKLILLSIICVLAFCSCQKNYAELAQGKWRMDTDASYFTKNNKRHYANEYNRGRKIGNYEMEFHDGIVEINISEVRDNSNVRPSVTEDDGTSNNVKKETNKTFRYHFDEDYVYIDGEAAHILKLNNERMVIEGGDDGELAHMEFFRIE